MSYYINWLALAAHANTKDLYRLFKVIGFAQPAEREVQELPGFLLGTQNGQEWLDRWKRLDDDRTIEELPAHLWSREPVPVRVPASVLRRLAEYEADVAQGLAQRAPMRSLYYKEFYWFQVLSLCGSCEQFGARSYSQYFPGHVWEHEDFEGEPEDFPENMYDFIPEDLIKALEGKPLEGGLSIEYQDQMWRVVGLDLYNKTSEDPDEWMRTEYTVHGTPFRSELFHIVMIDLLPQALIDMDT